MNRVSQSVMRAWIGLGTRFLPFADAATPDLPLPRLLRLSLFQVSVGMSLVLLVGTLNRVMIVELGVPASLVAVMLALPLLFAPFRALIGFRSDTHRSALGWRRVPFVYKGTMVQFAGLALMPFALLVLSGQGNAGQAPAWVGQLAAGVAFLLVGAGIHITQTAGLALATDLAPVESQPRVVGLMYVMLLLGSIVSALIFGWLLTDFTAGRLIQVIQGSALATIILNGVAVWKQEPRSSRGRDPQGQRDPSFRESWSCFVEAGQTVRRLLAVGLGTLAFSMQDVMLEPYGGQILGLAVSDTTKLTAAMAAGGLVGFAWASNVLGRGADPFRMACYGALIGIPAFIAIIAAAPLNSPLVFGIGTLLVGFGGGLFGHGTLTATMNFAPEDQRGLALGAWGAVQATAAGAGVALGGVIRDLVMRLVGTQSGVSMIPYVSVYIMEMLLLFVAVAVMMQLIRHPHALADGKLG